MMRLLQNLVVWLDVGLARRVFHSVYALGVRIALARIASHPAVHSVYGCGSFFEDRCLHGHSDVDLVIVLRDTVRRGETGHHELARRYESVRRWFPFLGRWGEKEGSLVFLADARNGNPVLPSFVLRNKQGRLRRMAGASFPYPIEDGELQPVEVLEELATLIRTAVLTGEQLGRRLLLWERLFTKTAALAEGASLADVARGIHSDPELGFLSEPDRQLFFRRADPAALFRRLMVWADRLRDAFAEGDEAVDRTIAADGGSAAGTRTFEAPARTAALVAGSDAHVERVRALAALPFGLRPTLLYFPPDCPMPVVELSGEPYADLRALIRTVERDGEPDDVLIARTAGHAFLVSRQRTYVEVVALDRLCHGDLYARLEGATSFRVPKRVLAGLRADAGIRFEAIARGYEKHEGHVPKEDYACVYYEEDLQVFGDGLSMMRAYASVTGDGVYLHEAQEIADHFAALHPACRGFLDDLVASFHYLGAMREANPRANNVYRCLHQFMPRLLRGERDIHVDDPRKRLPITVGLITRNRAGDLVNALASLLIQLRAPDEVVVVDNGSTDGTRDVVASFADRLPIVYAHLDEPSIPGARNLVLETATREVVAFTDDDAICEPEWLDSVERAFLRADNIGIVGGWVEHWPAPQWSTVDTYYATFHSNKPERRPEP